MDILFKKENNMIWSSHTRIQVTYIDAKIFKMLILKIPIVSRVWRYQRSNQKS